MPIRLECFGENCYKFIWEISGIVPYDIILSTTGFDQNLFEYAPNGAYMMQTMRIKTGKDTDGKLYLVNY